MKIEDIKDLLEEIASDKNGDGYIDCGTASDYTDNHQYERIIAAVKQNIALQQENAELTKKLEEVERQGMESLIKLEAVSKTQKEQADIANRLIDGVSQLITDNHVKDDKVITIGDYIFDGKAIRIGDYIFYSNGGFHYDPIKEVEPIELKIKITENSDKNKICPICKGDIGEYPAISRRDNKTEICSHCGMMEALEEFHKANKDDENETDI